MSVNFLDVIYIVVTSLSIASGIYRGSIKITISFIFFILSFIFTYFLFTPIAEIINEYVANNFISNIASSFISYLISVLFCSFISGKLQDLVKDISGGGVDRLLGFILGTIRGIIMSLIIFVLILIMVSKSYQNSHNILELLVPKEQKKQDPHWVSSSRLNSMLHHLLQETIEYIGKDTLKHIALPKYFIPKDTNQKNDETQKMQQGARLYQFPN